MKARPVVGCYQGPCGASRAQQRPGLWHRA